MKHTAGYASFRGRYKSLSLIIDGLIAQDADWSHSLSKTQPQNPLRMRLDGWSDFLGLTLRNGIDGRLIWHPRHQYVYRLGAHPTLSAEYWLGVLRFEAIANGHAVGYLGEDGVNMSNDHRLEGHTRLTVSLGVLGHGRGMTHRSAIGLRGEISDIHRAGIDTDTSIWLDGFDERSIEAEWVNTWRMGRSSVRARIYQGYDDALPAIPWQPTSGEASWETPYATVSARLIGLQYQRASMRLGTAGQTFISFSALHIDDSDADTFWLRHQDDSGSYLQTYPDDALWTLSPGGGFQIGPFGLQWMGSIDPVTNGLLGHSGSIRWVGRCQCWSVIVAGNHEPQPKRMRIFASFQLTTLDRGDTKAH